jgi:uncharacterized protein YjeT (DUF2065 family)
VNNLTAVALLAGILLALIHAPLVVSPAAARRFFGAFPRNRVAAWVLTALDLAWAAWLMYQVPLGRFEGLKEYLPALTPILFFLIVFLVDELLAPRALGGLLVLIPAPVLDIARWHESPLRLVVVGFAYVLVVAGIVLLLSPYWFRKASQALLATDRSARGMGVAGLLVGLVLLVLALAVY